MLIHIVVKAAIDIHCIYDVAMITIIGIAVTVIMRIPAITIVEKPTRISPRRQPGD